MGEKRELISSWFRENKERELESIRKLSLHVLKKINYKLNTEGRKPNIEALSSGYEHICYFNSNSAFNDPKYTRHSGLLAIGKIQELVVTSPGKALEQLQSFYDNRKGWIFGYLSYDLKNETEDLHSKNSDGLNFPLLHFFTPKVVIEIKTDEHILHFDDEFLTKEDAERIYSLAYSERKSKTTDPTTYEVRNKITKEEYLDGFNELKKHILRGDIYEINFCQEFFAENAVIDPPDLYEKLNTLSKAPFSAFCRFDDHYLISSSPERFIKKEGTVLLSQPIKGTIRRGADNNEDERLRATLRSDPKEQNENVMIVDLVRNDLSRIAKKGSVNVNELFGIYSFRQVHQMISTVSCELKENILFTDILKAAFPMGSMTGAPKLSAMKLIEEHENTRRGLYSGAVGYVDPEGNFDFSVVIRSILYNSSKRYLSFMTGSAITSNADGEQEYAECLLKAQAMFNALK